MRKRRCPDGQAHHRPGVVPNNKAISEVNKYHGYFVLVSNKEKDPFECLRKYRKRETIESFFEAEKQHADGTRARVWYTDTLRGRMFVQFVSLCYYEYFSEEIRRLKNSLGNKTGDEAHDKKQLLMTSLALNHGCVIHRCICSYSGSIQWKMSTYLLS